MTEHALRPRDTKLQSSSLKMDVLDFPIIAPFRNHNASKATRIENGSHNLHCLASSVKFRYVLAKCLESVLRVQPRSKLLIYV